MEGQQTSAGGIVIRRTPDGEKVLLIKDRFGYWTWPKGHLENDETPQEAALREIAEETGISNLAIIDEIGEQKYSCSSGTSKVLKTVHIFLMEASGSDAIKVQTEEISSAEWVSPDEAIKKIGYDGSRDMLNKALEIFSAKKG